MGNGVLSASTLNGECISQNSGFDTEKVMSQKAITDMVPHKYSLVLKAEGWSDNKISVLADIAKDNTCIVFPGQDSIIPYTNSRVTFLNCVDGAINFICSSKPNTDISIDVLSFCMERELKQFKLSLVINDEGINKIYYKKLIEENYNYTTETIEIDVTEGDTYQIYSETKEHYYSEYTEVTNIYIDKNVTYSPTSVKGVSVSFIFDEGTDKILYKVGDDEYFEILENSELIIENKFGENIYIYSVPKPQYISEYNIDNIFTRQISYDDFSYLSETQFVSPTKYGTTTSLNNARYYLSATYVGNYALFAGGCNDGYYSIIDAYDNNLTHSAISDGLGFARAGAASINFNEKAFFGSGYASQFMQVSGGAQTVHIYWPSCDVIDKSLTRSSVEITGADRKQASKVNEYALFAGGLTGDPLDLKGENDYSLNTVDAISKSLEKISVSPLTTGRTMFASAFTNDHALFAGGSVYSSGTITDIVSSVEAYDSSLTKINSIANLTSRTTNLIGTDFGNYAIFGGGFFNQNTYKDINVYDSSLTKINISSTLNTSVYQLTATHNSGYAFFAGGQSGQSSFSKDVDIFDSSFTHTYDTSGLSVGRRLLTATKVGNYILFAGGSSGQYDKATNVYSTVDVYSLV